MDNSTYPVTNPWGYEYLPTQGMVDAQWIYQLIVASVLGGYLWDTVISVPGDCQFLFSRRFNHVSVIYIVNRLSTCLCVAGFFSLAAAPLENCSAVSKLTAIAELISQFTSSALLFIRVWALFKEQIYIPILFALVMPVGPILSGIVWYPIPIHNFPGNTGCGYNGSPPDWGYTPYLLQVFYDLAVFLLCTGKLLHGSGCTMRSLLRGNNLMEITHEFIISGFVYYIPNVVVQVVTMGFLLGPTSNPDSGFSLQYVTTSIADATASAQSLRITRNLSKAGQQAQRLIDEASSNRHNHHLTDFRANKTSGGSFRESPDHESAFAINRTRALDA